MIIRFDAAVRGGHAHVRVWAGTDREHLALCGRLCFRVPEWVSLRQLLCGRPGTSRLTADYGESVEVVQFPDFLENSLDHFRAAH